ncbi:hypothetical protein C7U60_18910 [Mesorhizobium plurifarium]|nr:hypothetical protein C7U60_18910 [Mesorhizobium plurifarium]
MGADQIKNGLSLWLDEQRGSCVDDLQDARVKTTLALGRVQSCVRPVDAAVGTAGLDEVRGPAP